MLGGLCSEHIQHGGQPLPHKILQLCSDEHELFELTAGVSCIQNHPTLATAAGGCPRACELKHQCRLVLKHAKHAKDTWNEEGEGAPPCGNGWVGCK